MDRRSAHSDDESRLADQRRPMPGAAADELNRAQAAALGSGSHEQQVLEGDDEVRDDERAERSRD